MDKTPLAVLLARWETQSKALHEGAEQWLREAKTPREQELALRLLRHAKGAHTATTDGRQELLD